LAQDYSIVSRLNGKPAIVIPVYQLPGTNAVQTAAGVRKLMVEMKQSFPEAGHAGRDPSAEYRPHNKRYERR